MKLRIPTILIFRSYLLVFRWGAGESIHNTPFFKGSQIHQCTQHFHGHDAPWDAPLIASRRAVVPSSALKQQTNRGELNRFISTSKNPRGLEYFFKIPTSFLFFLNQKIRLNFQKIQPWEEDFCNTQMERKKHGK